MKPDSGSPESLMDRASKAVDETRLLVVEYQQLRLKLWGHGRERREQDFIANAVRLRPEKAD